MKKTLVAIAALAAFGAQAQSSVTISGSFDAGYKAVSGTSDATAKNTSIAQNNTSTSAIFFKGTEDLGGGMKASFLGEADIQIVQASTGNAATGGQYYGGNSLLNGEQFVGLSGGFGGIKLGSPNSAVLETNGKAQPFGTALGGGYSSSGLGRNGVMGKFGVNQFVGGPSAGNRVVRNEKTVRYDSPVFSGFAASYEMSFQNDKSATVSSNQNGFTSLGLTYANGPLNVAYATATAKAGANQAAGNYAGVDATAGTMAPVASNLSANAEVKHTFAAANYNMGALTVYGGLTSTKTSNQTANAEDMTSSNIAAKYVVGQYELLANMVSVKDKSSARTGAAVRDGKLTGLGVNYLFSKTTNAYVRYEAIDTNTNDSTATATGGKQNVLAIGMKQAF